MKRLSPCITTDNYHYTFKTLGFFLKHGIHISGHLLFFVLTHKAGLGGGLDKKKSRLFPKKLKFVFREVYFIFGIGQVTSTQCPAIFFKKV